MEAVEEYSGIFKQLREKAHAECSTCDDFLREIEFWIKELTQAKEEMEVLKQSLACDNALAMKKRRLETEEFEAMEKLDELIEEMEEHLG